MPKTPQALAPFAGVPAPLRAHGPMKCHFSMAERFVCLNDPRSCVVLQHQFSPCGVSKGKMVQDEGKGLSEIQKTTLKRTTVVPVTLPSQGSGLPGEPPWS